MMDQQRVSELEYEARQAEKRDKLNARLQLWSLFFGLVSGAGLVSVQTGTLSSLVALYPFLAMCLARYAAHSERVLDQVNKQQSRRRAGSHLKAFRDAVLLSQVVATGLLVLRAPMLWQRGSQSRWQRHS